MRTAGESGSAAADRQLPNNPRRRCSDAELATLARSTPHQVLVFDEIIDLAHWSRGEHGTIPEGTVFTRP